MTVLRNFSKQLVHLWKKYVSAQLFPLFTAIEIAGLGIAGIALWGFGKIADEVMEQETQAFDTSILEAIARFHSPVLNSIMIFITTIGEPTVLLVLALILAIVLLAVQERREALMLAIASGGGLALNFALKAAFNRARPELWDRIVDVSFKSFPSGHATMSLVVYGAIGYGLARQFPAWQKLIATITVLLVSAIGFSRLYLGVHWPTDVIAGYATGLVWLIACILTLEISSRYSSGKETNPNA
ncbi:phosphatase PAP2 family protein [Oscillatoria sp. FACHB-1406]|uniref:phosphatase PAP2 family protein n=1 Tax=Oscillatoria sp. FACHB-1406 TaxID=2692846 RepID=UPI001682F5A5|nr:phosphatase PAP2 family protein [Oscillatoria sp. FACHB-1406]MBD2578787.1 phosphatase PAP2 family protein [Oscillatoria sp. FACHB-1406]